jgi:hypothetical protein
LQIKEENPEFYKSESEALHKLIKDLNEQAMNTLYSHPMQNVSRETGGKDEYLVIQRRLSEMKPHVVDGATNGNSDL